MARFHAKNPGELIRRARHDAGLTQSDLASRAGLRQPSLAQMESGKRAVSPEMLDRVLEAADYRPALALARDFQRIRELAADIGLRNVRVFGSVARGEDRFDSDIDLLVTPDAGIDLLDVAYFSEQVRLITGFPVDVNVDNGTVPPGWNVLREAIPL